VILPGEGYERLAGDLQVVDRLAEFAESGGEFLDLDLA
jgi:hypothetical protein